MNQFVCIAGLTPRLIVGLPGWLKQLAQQNSQVKITATAGFGWTQIPLMPAPVVLHLVMEGTQDAVIAFMGNARSYDEEYAPLLSFGNCSVPHTEGNDISPGTLVTLNFHATPGVR